MIMRKTNKLLSIILALAMLVSLMPTVIFAAGGKVARIGDTEYDTFDEAYKSFKAGGTIELLADATTNVQFSDTITVKMNGYCITSSGTNLQFNSGRNRKFENGTIVGTLRISGSGSANITLTAPETAEYALDGGINFTGSGGSAIISGAKVGLKGTLNTNTKVDISGTDKAVELTAEPTISASYRVLGSTNVNTVPTVVAVYDSTEKTYMVNGAAAKRIKIERLPAPNAPILSEASATICAGQSATFGIEYTGTPALIASISGTYAGNNKIKATVAADRKSVTVSTEKDMEKGSYLLIVYPESYSSKRATARIIVTDPCDHKENGEYIIDSDYKCTKCNAQMVASVEKSGVTDYYDSFWEALDSTPTSGNPEDCKLTLLKSIELDYYMSVEGKTFTYVEAKDAELGFAKIPGTTVESYYNIEIKDDNGNPSNIVIDSLDNSTSGNVFIEEINLFDSSKLTTKENTTIGELSLRSINASFYLGGKVSTLSANIPYPYSKNLVEYLDEDTVYYNYETKTWVSSRDANRDTLKNVTMKKKPFKNFSVNSSSGTVEYPGSNAVTFGCEIIDSASFDPAKAKITTSNLPAGGVFVQGRNEKFNNNCSFLSYELKNFPAGEYTIPFTLEYDGYTETQNITFKVLPCSVDKSNDITVEINGKTDNLIFKYARGEQTLDVKVFEKDANATDGKKDVTDSFTIKGNTVTNVDEYTITITAKNGTNYSGEITKKVIIEPISPVENIDYKVVMPTNLKYDGNPKEVKIVELSGSGISSENENLKMYYSVGAVSPVITAPTEPGTYKATMWMTKRIGNYETIAEGVSDFTIKKADSEFEFTDLKTSYGFEESAKIKGKIKKAGENAAVPSGKVKISEVNGSDRIPVAETTLDKNGEFEFNSNDLTANLITPTGTFTFEIEYSGDKLYNDKTETGDITITKTPISLNVSNTEHRYAPATERKIAVTLQGTSNLTADSFIVRYYLVDENSGKLTSVNPVEKTISAGRYLYVISFKNDVIAKKYALNGNMFELNAGGALKDTAVPDISAYSNIGFMDIKAASEVSQKPISFKKGTVTLKQSSDFAEVNTLVNDNNSTVTYESSDTSVAEVDVNGKVKAVKSGTATITATSIMTDATPVYASYTVTVKKELTKNSFNITAVTKTYDGSKNAEVTAVLTDKSDENDVVNVSITAVFDSADAGNDKNVSYEITGISGKDADKYILSDVSENLKGTVNGTIKKAPVSVICAKLTTRTFDNNAQTVDVSAIANGKMFDSYTVKYNDSDSAVAVGEYTITIVLNPDAEKNYYVLPFAAKLKIVNAAQDVFSIEDIPENVYYGDEFKVTALGANGDVTYKITNGSDIASVDENSGKVTIKDVGTVTITATSTKDGYTNKTAVRTFAAKPRILTPVVEKVTDRTYDGSLTVDVSLTLENTVNGDENKNKINTSGTMLTPDAGDGKAVYITVDLPSSMRKHYTLSTNTLQSSVSIAPIQITKFTISALNKKYDGTQNAQVNIESISDILSGDKGLVSISGDAEFESADASADKQTVTFTAASLTGTKSANYTLGTDIATAKAYIEPLEVKFTIGQTSFVYDGTDKEITASATDENGRIFTDFDVDYDKTPNNAGDYKASIVLRDKNYYTKQGDIDVKITEATQDQLVIAGLPGTVEYGSEFKLSAFGGTDGGEISWNVIKGNAEILKDTDGNGDVKITGIGKIEIEAVKTSDNYKNVSAKVIFTAMPKNITFELSNLEQTYGEVLGITVTPSDSDVTDSDFEVTYNNSSDVPENAGRYTVKVKTTDENENYKGSATATFVINKATISGGSISGINDSYTYGNVISGASVSGIPNDTSAKITYAGTGIYIPREEAPTNAGNYTAIATITGENYETLTLTKEFSIKKAPLTVTAENKSRAYGEANPIFTLSYDGFINGETKDVLLYEPTAVTLANASSKVGEYDINVSGGYAENYEFTYQPGKLTITGAQSSNLYITNLPGTVYVNNEFTLFAFYGSAKVDAAWESSNPEIASVDANGKVTAKKAGTVTITATADSNYNNASVSVELTVKQASITLVPKELVKVYNGQRQEIGFEDVPGFTPVFSGEGKNVDVKYTLITDPTVTEPINAGTYSVTYTVNDGGFIGGGTTTMYINKATVEVKPKNISKVYGSKAEFKLETSSTIVSEAELSEFEKSASFTSDGAPENAPVKDGGYDITVTLSKPSSENINFVVNGTGKLTVEKAPLSIAVKDVSREYGAENPVLEALYDGFVNDETKDVLGGELKLAYDDDINAATPVGTYNEKTSASGLESNNYDITYKKGNVEITKIKVAASAGTARNNYLTVEFDKEIKGLLAGNFVVKSGTAETTLTSVTENNGGKSYTLNGSFTTGIEYTVEIKLDDAIYEITGSPVTLVPTGSSGGGGGGGGSSLSYTVSFNTNGGSKISSQAVSRNGSAKMPEEPKKDGFVFDGWYTDKDLKTEYDFAAKVTKNITLYAKWSETTVDNTKNEIILIIGEKNAKVFGSDKTNDVAPKVVNDRTMLPARFVAENLGATVEWDGENKIVTIKGKNTVTGEDVTIIITIGAESAVVNGKEVKLDSPAFVENDRTYTPVRFISEELGAKVDWIGEEQKVVITKLK